jgi:hypothetical protein
MIFICHLERVDDTEKNLEEVVPDEAVHSDRRNNESGESFLFD